MSGLSYNKHLGRWHIVCRDGTLVYFYRAVMEAHIGRELTTDEHVHHINGDKTDDRIENLQLLTKSEHHRLHGGEGTAARKAKWKYEWSAEHPYCVECDTTERRHVGHGKCSRCYFREHMRKRRKAERESGLPRAKAA